MRLLPSFLWHILSGFSNTAMDDWSSIKRDLRLNVPCSPIEYLSLIMADITVNTDNYTFCVFILASNTCIIF